VELAVVEAWLVVVLVVVPGKLDDADVKASENCSQGFAATVELDGRLEEEAETVEEEDDVEEGVLVREDERVAVTMDLLEVVVSVAVWGSLDVEPAGGSLAECEPRGPRRGEVLSSHSSHLPLHPL